VGTFHPGSSSLDLAVLGASHVRRSGEDPTSNPTNPGTTSDSVGTTLSAPPPDGDLSYSRSLALS
jgi:hypothetical protein